MTGSDFGRILDEWERRVKTPESDTEDVFRNALDEYLPDVSDEKFSEPDMTQDSTDFSRLKSEATLDLHGMRVEEAVQLVQKFLRESQRRGLRKVTVVHGKGNHNADRFSRLKQVVTRELERSSIAGRTMQPPRHHGGSGATWVMIRPYRSR